MILKVFGIARDIMGGREVEVKEVHSVSELRQKLLLDYPRLKDLNSFLIAVNQKYAPDEIMLNEEDEIAIIPPVSGG